MHRPPPARPRRFGFFISLSVNEARLPNTQARRLEPRPAQPPSRPLASVPVPEPARDPPLARRAAVRHVPRDCGRTLSRSPPPPAPRQAGLADEVYSEGGGVKQKSGLLSAFSFVREKRDDMMPSMAKKV